MAKYRPEKGDRAVFKRDGKEVIGTVKAVCSTHVVMIDTGLFGTDMNRNKFVCSYTVRYSDIVRKFEEE